MSDAIRDRLLSRRRFLWLAGATGGLVAVGCQPIPGPPAPGGSASPSPAGCTLLGMQDEVASVLPGPWSDPATWGGRLPGSTDNARIGHAVVLDQSVSVAGVTIAAGATLTFHPEAPATLTSTGNVVVDGRLVMRPASPLLHHELSFTGIDECNFVGGGMDPVPSDVGLWVMGDGELDLAGAPKASWARSSGDVPAGARAVVLDADPVGWQVGDEIVITPTVAPNVPNHHLAYDTATISAVAGRQVTISAPTAHAHPAVGLPDGSTLGAEVLNLSRNVRIGGTPEGRTHIFVRSTKPQSVRNVAIHDVGPRTPDPADPGYTTFVLGRYGLHLHMCDQGSVGSVVEGTVIRDAGSHAFVAHLSDGVTFTGCISHNTIEDPYWWDQRVTTGMPGPPTNGTTYERCIASLVRSIPSFRGYQLTGFALNDGTGNACRDCVAVGVQGNKNSSGFNWPEGVQSTWLMSGCISHNNAVHGAFVWQNTNMPHVVQRLVAFHNGGAGIAHGAYLNNHRYEDCVLLTNGSEAIRLDAVSRGSMQLTFVRVHCEDQVGLSSFAVKCARHALPPGGSTRFEGCTFEGFGQAAIGVGAAADVTQADLVDFVDCSFDGNEMYMLPGAHADSVVRFSDPTHGIIQARLVSQPGTLQPAWNANVSDIPAFA